MFAPMFGKHQWEHQHLTHYCIPWIHTETYQYRILQKLPERILSRQSSVQWRPAYVERTPYKKLETAKQKPVFYIVAADVKALYPSLYRDTVTKALECALEKHSDYSAEARKIIVELNKICLNNVVTQYGDQLYIQKNGIITGDNHSVSLANTAVHYILQPIADVLNEAELFRRFIDDIIWISASEISNERIRQALTSAFENSGLELTFRQACTAEETGEVEFLYVNHCVTIEVDFVFVTKDFLKPTAEGRQFINGNSHYPQTNSHYPQTTGVSARHTVVLKR